MRRQLMTGGGLSRCVTLWAIQAVAWTSACSSDDQLRQSPVEVIRTNTWSPLATDDDPFALEFPEAVTACSSSGIDLTEGLLDVDTGVCGFVSAKNSLVADIRAGETVRLTFWHLSLTAAEPAVGQMRLRVADDTLFSVDVDIPSKEELYQLSTVATKDYPVGSQVFVHIHNHGANTWKVYQMTSGG